MNTCRPSYKLAFRYQHGPNETEVTRNDVFPCCIFLVKGNLRRLQFIGSLPWLRLNDPKPSTNFQGHFGHSTSPVKKEISTIRIRPYSILYNRLFRQPCQTQRQLRNLLKKSCTHLGLMPKIYLGPGLLHIN